MVSNGELILTDQQWLICMNQNFHLWWHSNDFINLLFSYVSICYSFVKQRSLLPTEAVWFQKHNFFQIDRIIANLSPFKLLIVKSWFGLTVSSNSDQHIFFFSVFLFEHSWRIMGFHFIVTNSILSDVQIVISLASWSFKKLASIPFDKIPLICESCFCSSFVPSLPYTRNQIHLKGSWLPLGEQWY